MNISVEYSALTRLLTQNNRVHDLEEMLRQMPVRVLEVKEDRSGSDGVGATEISLNPFAELQDERDREARATLVTCWLAMSEPEED